MIRTFSNPIFVEKEKVSSMQFPVGDVLSSTALQMRRSKALERAIDFGNFAQYKVVILFEDINGLKQVETTIWDMDERNVYLKNRITIPIQRILSIKL